jgi:polysaccharide pyruvyl transferase WcaK-like protein
VRDPYSHDYVIGTLGIKPDRVLMTADEAFQLRVPAELDARDEDGAALAPTADAWLAVSLVAPQYGGHRSVAALENYLTVLAGAIDDYLGVDPRRNVVVIPHLESSAHSDRILARRVKQLARYGDRVRVLAPCNPYDIIALMSRCQAAICTRMHSMIFAIDARTPFVAVSYLPKSDSMLETLGLGGWRVPMALVTQDSATGRVMVTEKLSALLGSYAEEKRRVADAHERVAAAANRNAELCADLLGATTRT